MDRELFYRKLIPALAHSGYVLRAGDISKEDLSHDRDPVSSAIRTFAQFATVGEIHPVFNQAAVQQRLDRVHDWATVVALRYVLGQPVILAVVEADRLSQQASLDLAKRLDGVVVEMLDATAILGGSNIGGFQASKGTRLSAMGIILNVFFDHTSASTFVERSQKKCKILHFFKKTWVLSWAIDVPNKTVINHRGLPFLPGVISRELLQKEIFGDPQDAPVSAALTALKKPQN